MFVASGAEKAVAVANLASFRRTLTIPLPHAPEQLLHSENRVFATCPEGRALVEIDAVALRLSGRIALPGRPVAARLSRLADGPLLAIVLTKDPGALLIIDLTKRRVVGRVALRGSPSDLDVATAENNGMAAISVPSRNLIMRVTLPDLKIAGATDAGVPCGPLRFRRDGKTILAGAATEREIVTIDSATGDLVARLPLPIVPSRFCFNTDGGQLFVTGSGGDVVAIVSPFQNEVDETILAGRTPCAMAVSDPGNLLFVTNIESGDLTILDIETRSVSATVHVGENPGEVLLTPDGEYALTIDRKSGNVSVVRVMTVISPPNSSLAARVITKPLFTVFPTAPEARSAIVVPYRS
jgi:YVTN family beta-propeller protein